MPFNAGDKVVFQADEMAEVQFGPVTSVSDKEAYLVKWLEGTCVGHSSIVWAEDLVPVPKFQVGQVVRARYLTRGLAKVAAGPFKGRQSQWYVLELPEGDHSMEVEEDISPVVE